MKAPAATSHESCGGRRWRLRAPSRRERARARRCRGSVLRRMRARADRWRRAPRPRWPPGQCSSGTSRARGCRSPARAAGPRRGPLTVNTGEVGGIHVAESRRGDDAGDDDVVDRGSDRQHQNESPWLKFTVPSIGSTCHVTRPVPMCRLLTTTTLSGTAPVSASRRIASDARSCSVTRSCGPPLCSTAIGRRKAPTRYAALRAAAS